MNGTRPGHHAPWLSGLHELSAARLRAGDPLKAGVRPHGSTARGPGARKAVAVLLKCCPMITEEAFPAVRQSRHWRVDTELDS
jgi:hypothetical protein